MIIIILLLVTTTEALRKCNNLCGDVEIKEKGKSSKDEDAAGLLLGIEDSDDYNRQFYDVFSLSDDKITIGIERLLSIVDPNLEGLIIIIITIIFYYYYYVLLYLLVYKTGRDLFSKRFRGLDLISSTPLEASYYWTLSCASALKNEIKFLTGTSEYNDVIYDISCKQLLKRFRKYCI